MTIQELEHLFSYYHNVSFKIHHSSLVLNELIKGGYMVSDEIVTGRFHLTEKGKALIDDILGYINGRGKRAEPTIRPEENLPAGNGTYDFADVNIPVTGELKHKYHYTNKFPMTETHCFPLLRFENEDIRFTVKPDIEEQVIYVECTIDGADKMDMPLGIIKGVTPDMPAELKQGHNRADIVENPEVLPSEEELTDIIRNMLKQKIRKWQEAEQAPKRMPRLDPLVKKAYNNIKRRKK
jgi:hypothetical protein